MKTFVFRCPQNGSNVQGWIPEDIAPPGDLFVMVDCMSCGRPHRINPKAEKELRERK